MNTTYITNSQPQKAKTKDFVFHKSLKERKKSRSNNNNNNNNNHSIDAVYNSSNKESLNAIFVYDI